MPSQLSRCSSLLDSCSAVDRDERVAQFAESYEQIADPDAHWRNFSGPCYVRKAAVEGLGSVWV